MPDSEKHLQQTGSIKRRAHSHCRRRFLRESILQPNAKIVNGFEANIMPNFQGQLSEENVIQLIAYLKSLTPAAPASQTGVLPKSGRLGNLGRGGL